MQVVTCTSQVIPLKVAGNPRTHQILCTAKGATPTVHFQPPSVNCGAILPATPVQVRTRVVTWASDLRQPVSVLALAHLCMRVPLCVIACMYVCVNACGLAV